MIFLLFFIGCTTLIFGCAQITNEVLYLLLCRYETRISIDKILFDSLKVTFGYRRKVHWQRINPEKNPLLYSKTD